MLKIEELFTEQRVIYGDDEPRLSAAIMIPSLYLIARTEVPVTIGCLDAGFK